MIDDLEMAEDLRGVYEPKGVCAVARHPHFEDIIDAVLAGWTPRQIEQWMRSKTPEIRLTWKEIDHYVREHVPRALISAEEFLRRHVPGTSAQVNELDYLQRLIRVCASRFERLYVAEEDSPGLMADDGRLAREVRLSADTLRKALLSSAELKMKLGLLTKVPEELRLHTVSRVSEMASSGVLERAGVPDLTDRQRHRVLQLASFLELGDAISGEEGPES